MTPRGGREVDTHEVVGMYGDPEASWGIGLEVEVHGRLLVADVERGIQELCARYPHLGAPEPVRPVSPDAWEHDRVHALGEAFRAGDRQIRILVGEADGRGRTPLLVALHHGLCDGLGMLALVAAGTGVDVLPTAVGVGERSSPRSFLTAAPSRLAEALFRPPPRFPARVGGPSDRVGAGGAGRELALVRQIGPLSVGTVALCQAVAHVFEERSRPMDAVRRRRGAARPLVFVGASRRPPGTVAPDRRTAYLRFRVDPYWTTAEAAEALRAVPPEPDFPETSLGGVAPRLIGLLRQRLGSTATVSNLGRLEGRVSSVTMFPALSGPNAVSVGMATTDEHTSVSLRTRAHEFDADDAHDLLDSLVARLTAARPSAP